MSSDEAPVEVPETEVSEPLETGSADIPEPVVAPEPGKPDSQPLVSDAHDPNPLEPGEPQIPDVAAEPGEVPEPGSIKEYGTEASNTVQAELEPASKGEETSAEPSPDPTAALKLPASENQAEIPKVPETAEDPTQPSDAPGAVGETSKQELVNKYADMTNEEIQQDYEAMLTKFGDSESGQKFLAALPEGVTLRDIVEGKVSKDPITYAAMIAEDGGVEPAQEGTLVHRVAELRNIHNHPDDLRTGVRCTEQRIDTLDEEGNKQGHVELDEVIVRGDNHYIRDYKPINLSEFESTEAGARWSSWMEGNFGSDFREKIRQGELNPIATKEVVPEPMDQDTRRALRDFMDQATQEHKEQLENYTQKYAEAKNLETSQVKAAVVRPYFVFR